MTDRDDAARTSAPKWLANGNDPLSHGLSTAFTTIKSDAGAVLATQILGHVRFHSAYRKLPAGYQFLLPNGAFVTVYDQFIGVRRRIMFMSARGPGKRFMPVAARAWPRNVPSMGPWFSWPLSVRKQRRLHSEVAHAVAVAYSNRDSERQQGTIVIDPTTLPARIVGE